MSKKLLILGNMSKPGVAEEIERLRGWFEQRAEIAAVLPANQPIPPGNESVDLAVVFGGDGTLLSAARLLCETDIPLMGVNMGKLGFLAEFNVEHMKRHLDEILSGQVAPTERMMLQMSVEGERADGFSSPAANDLAISAGAPFRMIDLLVAQGECEIARYLGDGLVISTPNGSTGYNMSCGGPILEPTLDAVAITPVAPHTLSLRPIVVRSDSPIRITAVKVNPGTTVTIDGQISRALCDGDVVTARRAEHGMKIIPHPGRGFFATLADKLHWGRSPHHS
ncbi:MAG: NAD(+)/NADH kinase [Planctomycetota bacterium]|jgi:NAD+ kinase